MRYEEAGPRKGVGFVIKEMWVVVAPMGDGGDEGVPSVCPPWSDIMMPLVGADPKRVEWLRQQAAEISRQTGQQLKLVKFTVREEVERFGAP